jgi:glycosyltransferase involved in cell wall biosynthesis
MRLKIALVCDWFPPRVGGIERQVWGLAGALAVRGHDVHVITATPGQISPAGTHVERLPLRRFAGVDVVKPYPSHFAVGRELLRREQFDLVHTHGLFSTCGLGMQWMGGGLGIPTVLTCHSLVPGMFRRAASRALAAVFARRLTAVTAVSHAVAGDVNAALGRNDAIVIPNGVELREWSVPGMPLDPVSMVAVTRLVPRRNPLALIRVASRILPRVRHGARLTIIGIGPERGRVEHAIQRADLADRIRILPLDEPRAVRDIVGRAALFLSACPDEAFGLAVLEARAAGVPVVALAGGGIGENVEHGRTGFLAGGEDELVDMAVRLMNDDLLRARVSAAAHVGIERFDWSRVVERYLELYAVLIDRRRRPEAIGAVSLEITAAPIVRSAV